MTSFRFWIHTFNATIFLFNTVLYHAIGLHFWATVWLIGAIYWGVSAHELYTAEREQ